MYMNMHMHLRCKRVSSQSIDLHINGITPHHIRSFEQHKINFSLYQNKWQSDLYEIFTRWKSVPQYANMCKHWDRVGLFKRGRGDKVKTFISLYIYPKTGRRSAKFVSMTELCSAHNAHNPVKFHVSRIYVGVGARICDFLKISEDKNGGLQCCKTMENIDSVFAAISRAEMQKWRMRVVRF